MNPNLKNLALTLFIIHAMTACSHETKRPLQPKDEVSIEAKQAAAENGTPHVTEVKFKKGSKELTQKEWKKIDLAFRDAEKTKKLDHILIAAWSDEELPAEDKKDLTVRAVSLAEARGEKIKNHLIGKSSELKIEIVNMAERTGKVKEFLKTEDARLQASFETAGIPNADSKKPTVTPKSSRAVIIFALKR